MSYSGCGSQGDGSQHAALYELLDGKADGRNGLPEMSSIGTTSAQGIDAAHWAVLPDWPCEDASASEVRRRHIATTVTGVEVLLSHLATPWCCCPAVQ